MTKLICTPFQQPSSSGPGPTDPSGAAAAVGDAESTDFPNLFGRPQTRAQATAISSLPRIPKKPAATKEDDLTATPVVTTVKPWADIKAAPAEPAAAAAATDDMEEGEINPDAAESPTSWADEVDKELPLPTTNNVNVEAV